MKTCHFYTTKASPVAILLPILISLTIIISSCTLNVPAVDSSKRETDVAKSVESTLNAEKVATYQAQQTLDASRPVATQIENPGTNATLQAQQSTLNAQATSILLQATQTSTTESSLVTPSPTSGGSLEPIQILDWKMAFWVYTSSGCEGGKPCWITNDDYKKHLGGSLILTSKKSYFIDPNWPNPYLVFWNKRDNPATLTVDVVIDGTPITLRQYPKGQKYWSSDAIDIRAYKGKEIIVRFVAPGKTGEGGGGNFGDNYPSTHWFVGNIQIFPSYKP
jgi:hypothetical protein